MTPLSALMAATGASVVGVRGPDTWSFLQSLLSQDLDPLGDGQGGRSLLLAPRGRLVAAFRVLRVGPEHAVLDAAPGVGPALVEALGRFKIRVAVEIEDRMQTWDVLSVRGPEAVAAIERVVGIDVPATQHEFVAVDDGYAVRADWGTSAGVDLVAPVPTIERVGALLADAGVVDDAAGLELARIAAGIPLQGRDIDDRTIPQEAFLERDAVSFTKGCFVGQELVCRIDTRGAAVPRYLRHVEIAGTDVPALGATIVVDGVERGVVTSAARDDDHVIALALVPRAVDPPADAEVQWDTERRHAFIRALPAP